MASCARCIGQQLYDCLFCWKECLYVLRLMSFHRVLLSAHTVAHPAKTFPSSWYFGKFPPGCANTTPVCLCYCCPDSGQNKKTLREELGYNDKTGPRHASPQNKAAGPPSWDDPEARKRRFSTPNIDDEWDTYGTPAF